MLAKGELNKSLTVHAHGFSKAAREQIEAAGGTCQLVSAAAGAQSSAAPAASAES